MYLTLTINPSIDLYMRLPEGQALKNGTPEAPSVNRALNEYFEAGGKGINVAKILKRLSPSSEVEATGFTAGFTGREVIDDIRLQGISASFIEVKGHTRVNLKLTDGFGIETEVNGPGPSITDQDIRRLISKIDESSCDTLFISGSLASGLKSDTYHYIANEVLKSKPGLRLVLDFEGEALLKCLELRPFLIKPNARELSLLTGMDISTGSDISKIKEAAKMLKDKGAMNVLVSLGDQGAAILTDDGGFFHVPGISGDVISTIGAGDTMTASYVYMLDRIEDAGTSLKFSNECAALSAFTSGLPGALDLNRIISRYN